MSHLEKKRMRGMKIRLIHSGHTGKADQRKIMCHQVKPENLARITNKTK